MALTKVDYVDGVTPIMAKNLNDIQNEVIANGTAIGTQATQISGKADATALASETAAREAADTTLGNEVDDLKSALELFNSYNRLEAPTAYKKSSGIEWTKIAGAKMTVTGVSTATSLYDIVPSSMPSWIIPGKTYHVEYSSQNVDFRILYKNDPAGTSVNILSTKTSADVTIPSDAVSIIIRYAVSTGLTVDETVEAIILNAETNDSLSARSKRTSDIVTPYDNPDLFDNFNKSGSQTTTEITWAWQADGGLHVTGTIGTTRFINLYNGALPEWLTAGKTYYLEYSSDFVRFRMMFKRDSSEASNTNFVETRTNDRITLPDTVANLIIRLAVSVDDAGQTIDEVIYPKFYEYMPDALLTRNQKVTMLQSAAPDYYEPEITDTEEKVRLAMTEPCLAFIWCTDLHYQSVIGSTVVSDSVTWMAANMRRLANDLRFDGLICTGDIVDAKPPRSTETTRKQIDYVMEQLHSVGLPMLYVMGNHDDNRYIGYGDSQEKAPFSMAEIYGRFISYAQPDKVTDINDPNGWNYYVDYEQFKIRCFVLDSNYFRSSTSNWEYGYSNKTVAWFSAELANVPQGYSVILLSHTSPVQANNVDGTYVNITNIYNAIDTFIQNGGNYICTLYGHSHVDFSNETPWLEITMGSGKAHNFVPDSSLPEGATAPTRTAGTITEQLFDVIVIKPNSRKIQTIRFGAGVDREWTY